MVMAIGGARIGGIHRCINFKKINISKTKWQRAPFYKFSQQNIISMDKIDYNVCSNWSVEGNKHLEDCIRCELQTDSSHNDEQDIFDVVSVDTCIQLEQRGDDKDVPCKITFSSKSPNHCIKKITILSEARNIELSGELNEYVNTCKGEFVDKVDEDFIIYKANLSLPSPSQSCSLKLLGLRNKDTLWIYGIFIQMQPLAPSPNYWKLDVSKISDRLKTSKTDITDKASRMINMISTFQQAPNSGHIFDFLKQVAGPQYRTLGELNSQAMRSVLCTRTNVEALNEGALKLDRGDIVHNPQQQHASSNMCINQGPNGNSTSELYKNLLEKIQLVVKVEVESMEKRLEQKMHQELSEISRKQDEILQLLKNKTSE